MWGVSILEVLHPDAFLYIKLFPAASPSSQGKSRGVRCCGGQAVLTGEHIQGREWPTGTEEAGEQRVDEEARERAGDSGGEDKGVRAAAESALTAGEKTQTAR